MAATAGEAGRASLSPRTAHDAARACLGAAGILGVLVAAARPRNAHDAPTRGPLTRPSRLQPEVGRELPADPFQLCSVQQASASEQAYACDGLQRCDVGVRLVVFRRSGLGAERYVRLRRAGGPSDGDDGDMAEPGVQRVDAQHYRGMRPEELEVDVPDLASERLRARHRLRVPIGSGGSAPW